MDPFGKIQNFGRGHYGEHPCEIINLDQWSLKEKGYTQCKTDVAHGRKTDHNGSPLDFDSGELKTSP